MGVSTARRNLYFLCINFGVGFAADGSASARGPETDAGMATAGAAAAAAAAPVRITPLPDRGPAADPLPATELAPLGAALPEAIAARQLAFEQRAAMAFPAALRRLSSLSGIATAIEERPARIAGGTAILSDAPPIRLVWRGGLAGLLDRLAALSGYDWTWRNGTVVFYRYWDVEQRAPSRPRSPASDPAGPSDLIAPDAAWIVEAGVHKTLRGVLESWARRAGWILVWKSARDYAVGSNPGQAPGSRRGQVSGAVFHGGFLEAVDLLLAGDSTRRALSVHAYTANRHLVIEDAGAAGR